MVATNMLLRSPPHAVEMALKKLGSDLRTARICRRLTIQDVAEKIGTGIRAVQDAEKGKASTSMVIYAALAWLYNFTAQLENLADPANDLEGQQLKKLRDPLRVRKSKGMSNDF